MAHPWAAPLGSLKGPPNNAVLRPATSYGEAGVSIGYHILNSRVAARLPPPFRTKAHTVCLNGVCWCCVGSAATPVGCGPLGVAARSLDLKPHCYSPETPDEEHGPLFVGTAAPAIYLVRKWAK